MGHPMFSYFLHMAIAVFFLPKRAMTDCPSWIRSYLYLTWLCEKVVLPPHGLLSLNCAIGFSLNYRRIIVENESPSYFQPLTREFHTFQLCVLIHFLYSCIIIQCNGEVSKYKIMMWFVRYSNLVLLYCNCETFSAITSDRDDGSLNCKRSILTIKNKTKTPKNTSKTLQNTNKRETCTLKFENMNQELSLNCRWILVKFSLNSRWILIEFLLNSRWILVEFSLNSRWILVEFSFNFPWILVEFSLNSRWILV